MNFQKMAFNEALTQARSTKSSAVADSDQPTVFEERRNTLTAGDQLCSAVSNPSNDTDSDEADVAIRVAIIDFYNGPNIFANFFEVKLKTMHNMLSYNCNM